MSKTKQTSIQYFLSELERMQYFIGNDMLQAFREAEEMHRSEIQDAYDQGEFDQGCKYPNDTASELYYNDAFKKPQNMSAERIQIDGVWYVKEHPTPIDYTEFRGCVYETREYCWEAQVLVDADGDPRGDCWVEFTDKLDKDTSTTDVWDNPNFFIDLYNHDPKAIKLAKECMNDQGVKDFTAFIKVLLDKGWLPNE